MSDTTPHAWMDELATQIGRQLLANRPIDPGDVRELLLCYRSARRDARIWMERAHAAEGIIRELDGPERPSPY